MDKVALRNKLLTRDFKNLTIKMEPGEWQEALDYFSEPSTIKQIGAAGFASINFNEKESEIELVSGFVTLEKRENE
jgi:hypothetical protein